MLANPHTVKGVPEMTDIFKVHQGDDYLEIECPCGMKLTARYPDDEDRETAEDMVMQLNRVHAGNLTE